MTPAELTAALRARALAEGFDGFGVARAETPRADAEALDRWLDRGFHAGMGWMERTGRERSDPAALLEGCRSVACVAMSYGPGDDSAAIRADRARVALYARGRDYHKVLGARLERLALWLARESGREARAFVDSGPVLERAFAQAAGIGWIGKNANLITRTRGSYVLLGEILSAAEIEPTEGPHADHCGSCTACLEACPVGAIVEAGVVDASRCISYWTIEHRGVVHEAKRAGNGDWIFGCDDCQTVCPWNLSFARAAAGDPFAMREDLAGLDPVEILGLDEKTFRRRFSGTALMRARWDGMRRNACIVLGNSGRHDVAPVLERALHDADPVVREHAAWALARVLGRPESAENGPS